MSLPRYAVSTSAGGRTINGKRHLIAVIDRHTGERIKWFRSIRPAMTYVHRKNRAPQ